MFKAFGCVLAVLLWLAASPVLADVLYGTCKNKEGRPVKAAISTNFDKGNKKFFPNKDGFYRIDFGDRKVGKIKVYVDGQQYTTMDIRDSTRLDIVLPPTTVLFGTCTRQGRPVKAAISTSFDKGKQRFFPNPKDGFYWIAFPDRTVRKITVYTNGKEYKTIEVDGPTQLNIDLP
jgi:hypothetical protein